MDKGLISFPWNVSGLLTIGISIRILSLKLKGTTLSLSIALRRAYTYVCAHTHTQTQTCMLIRFHTLVQTPIALSLRPNKKITNKPHCLFPQRISIRHKSAYTHTEEKTHTHKHAHTRKRSAFFTTARSKETDADKDG